MMLREEDKSDFKAWLLPKLDKMYAQAVRTTL
jgi:hypothetical protein